MSPPKAVSAPTKVPASVQKPATAVTKPTAPVPALVKPVPATAKTEAPKTISVGGTAAVQIGAYSSQALADKGWNDAIKVAPGAAVGKGKKIEAVDKDGSTLFRTTVTGFSSRESATAFCNQLKATGKNCFVK